jgi:hypothetical protein
MVVIKHAAANRQANKGNAVGNKQNNTNAATVSVPSVKPSK